MPSRSRVVSKKTVDVSDLTEEERDVIVRFTEVIRRRRMKRGSFAEERAFSQFWNKLKTTSPAAMSEAEAEEIAAEARAFARTHP